MVLLWISSGWLMRTANRSLFALHLFIFNYSFNHYSQLHGIRPSRLHLLFIFNIVLRWRSPTENLLQLFFKNLSSSNNSELKFKALSLSCDCWDIFPVVIFVNKLYVYISYISKFRELGNLLVSLNFWLNETIYKLDVVNKSKIEHASVERKRVNALVTDFVLLHWGPSLFHLSLIHVTIFEISVSRFYSRE